MNFEFGLVGFAALICVGILLHHPSRTLGLPSLLIFMAVGLVIGNGEFGFVYDNFTLTSAIGAIALNIIVFVGGLSTSTQSIKVAYKEGGVLSSLGVVFSTVVFAGIFMDHGHRIHVEPACALVPGGVDTPEDLAAVRAWFEDHPE